MLIKPREQIEFLIPAPMMALRDMIQDTVLLAIKSGVNVMERYMYLTVDQRNLERGETLRTPGWHSDGFQGNEVSVKRPGDYQGVWCNTWGTEYADQTFEIDGLNPGVHNIFNHIALQIRQKNIRTMTAGALYTHGPYLIHRSPAIPQECYRRFVRISITHIPITSQTMTTNPLVEYDYPIHTTDGKIPSHLR